MLHSHTRVAKGSAAAFAIVAAAFSLSIAIGSPTSARTPATRTHVHPNTCCGWTPSPFSHFAKQIATNGANQWVVDNMGALYEKSGSAWVPIPSPTALMVAADAGTGAAYILTTGGTIEKEEGLSWSPAFSQPEPMSFIGDDEQPGSIDAVGTIKLKVGGFQYYYCVDVSSAECIEGPFGSGDNPPPGGSLFFAGGSPLVWNVNHAHKAYQSAYCCGAWVDEPGVLPVTLSQNTPGMWAADASGALWKWVSSSWVSVPAPPNIVKVSVGPVHVWLLDSSGNIYFK